MCNWYYGARDESGPNGEPFNIKLGNQLYEIQSFLSMNTQTDTGSCTMSRYTTPTSNAIGVQSAVLGDRGCASFVDYTQQVGQACNGLASCSAAINGTAPAGCVNQVVVQWACADGPHLETFASGAPIALGCP